MAGWGQRSNLSLAVPQVASAAWAATAHPNGKVHVKLLATAAMASATSDVIAHCQAAACWPLAGGNAATVRAMVMAQVTNNIVLAMAQKVVQMEVAPPASQKTDRLDKHDST